MQLKRWKNKKRWMTVYGSVVKRLLFSYEGYNMTQLDHWRNITEEWIYLSLADVYFNSQNMSLMTLERCENLYKTSIK